MKKAQFALISDGFDQMTEEAQMQMLMQQLKDKDLRMSVVQYIRDVAKLNEDRKGGRKSRDSPGSASTASNVGGTSADDISCFSGSEGTPGSRGSDAQGSRQSLPSQKEVDEKQLNHRKNQIVAVKARPEYQTVVGALFARTGTPDPAMTCSNRQFESERQIWHRSIHMCSAVLNGKDSNDRPRPHIELLGEKTDPFATSRRKGSIAVQIKKEHDRERRAQERAESMLQQVYQRQTDMSRGYDEPFPDCHFLVQYVSDQVYETWAKPRGAICSATLGDPLQGGRLVHCCQRFPELSGYSQQACLYHDLNFLQHGLPGCPESTRRGMREVVVGERASYTCILTNMRTGSQEFQNCLHLSNIQVPVDGEEKHFIIGIQTDVTGLYLNSDDLPELEATVAQITSEALSQWDSNIFISPLMAYQ